MNVPENCSAERTRHSHLEVYHALGPDMPVGHLPSDSYREVRNKVDASGLDPLASQDYAWLLLEESLAMAVERNPENGKGLYRPKEVKAAAQEAAAMFGQVMGDNQAPPSLRARAMLDRAGIELYHSMVKGAPLKAGSQLPKQYLDALSAAARLLLDIPPESRTHEDNVLMDSMTSIAVLTESLTGWTLLASPRQRHQVSLIHPSGAYGRVVVADADDIQGCVRFEPWVLGHDLRLGDEPRSVLAIVANKKSRGSLSPTEEMMLREVMTRHAQTLHRHETVQHSPTITAVGEMATAAAAQKSPVEISWYLRQPNDARGLPSDTSTLRIQVSNLLAAKDRLRPADLNTLSWMQLELACLTANGPHPEDSGAQFVAARTTLEEAMKTSPGIDLQDLRVNQAGFLAYEQLYSGASTEPLRIANSYAEALLQLHTGIKKIEHSVRIGSEEHELLQVTAIRVVLGLLSAAARDETARHLILPASPRALGTVGEIDALAFPIDFANESYDTDNIVTVRFAQGAAVEAKRRSITVGIESFLLNKSALQFLDRLVATCKGDDLSRAANFDRLATRFSDAIVDASEWK